MTKKADTSEFSELVRDILEGLEEARAYFAGEPSGIEVVEIPTDVDVAAVRAKTQLTQAQFAGIFGFSVRTLQQWEQGRRRPERSARVLLTLIDRDPEGVIRTLSGRPSTPRRKAAAKAATARKRAKPAANKKKVRA